MELTNEEWNDYVRLGKSFILLTAEELDRLEYLHNKYQGL